MTTTYWVIAGVAYVACGIVVAAMIHDWVFKVFDDDFCMLLLYAALALCPLVAPAIAINYLASKMRKDKP